MSLFLSMALLKRQSLSILIIRNILKPVFESLQVCQFGIHNLQSWLNLLSMALKCYLQLLKISIEIILNRLNIFLMLFLNFTQRIFLLIHGSILLRQSTIGQWLTLRSFLTIPYKFNQSFILILQFTILHPIML